MSLIHKARDVIYNQFSEQFVKPAQQFFRKETASGLILLTVTIIAMIWANSAAAHSYHHIGHIPISLKFGELEISHGLIEWIDDGLMAFFFFLVGLEIKREILVGELSSPKKALLPVMAALGGMLVPGLLYYLFNRGHLSIGGWGIPMATDIAFAMGAISIFGKRLPAGLRIFLAAFAIADDLGAVFVIALFYTKGIVLSNLFICGLFMILLAIANFFWIRYTIIYAVLGILIWLYILGSGIHSTVAGILVSLFIPAQGKYDTDKFIQQVKNRLNQFECEEQSCGYSIFLNDKHQDAVQGIEFDCHNVETPLQRMEHSLHPWVAFVILPLFAFGNAGLTFNEIHFPDALFHPVTLGIIAGLFIGKPLGILLFSYLAVKTKIASMPLGVRWPHIFGAAMLGGIGFTMSLFVSKLSFTSIELLDYSKFAILAASLLSALVGIIFLFLYSNPARTKNS